MSKCPQVNFGQQKSKKTEKKKHREGGDKGDHHRIFLAVNLHPPPVPLAYPTVISL